MSKNKLSIVILLISVLPYLNTISNAYSLDDDFVTEVNSTTNGFASFKEIFTTHYIEDKGGYSYEYRPIVKLSFAIEHQFFGVKPAISHLINSLLYGLFCLILFKFLVCLFSDNYNNILFFSVILFSVFPIHTEVVASLKNRDILLSGIFALSAGIQILKKKEGILKYTSVLLFVFLAFGSKQDALGLVLAMSLILFLVKEDISFRKKGLLILLLTSGIFLFWITKKIMIDSPGNRTLSFYENPLIANQSALDIISTMFFTIGFYTKQILFPFKMSCYYGYDFTNFSSFKNIITFFGIIVFIGLSWLFFKNRFQKKILLVGLIFIAVFFAMYSNILVKLPGVVADRFAFFPSIGFCLITSFTLLKGRFEQTFQLSQLNLYKIPILLVLLVFVVSCMKRNVDWKDRLTLFSTDVEKYPKSYKLLTMLATEQIQRANNSSLQISQYERQTLAMIAFKNFQKANSIYDKDYETLNNLGYFEMNFNKNYSEALRYFQSSLREKSSFPDVYFNIGIVYKKLNQLDSSFYYLNDCINKYPQFTNAYNYLAEAYFTNDLSEKMRDLIKLEKKNNLPNQLIQNHESLLLRMNNSNE
jgi:tetratricopeptide (TPR) repeat protein